MFSKFLVLPVLAIALQAQILVPQLGSIRCSDGSVRPVLGVPASFVLGKPFASSAISASFSEQGGIIAAGGGVQLLDASGKLIGEFKTADPGALVDIDSDSSSALAWLPRTASLLIWNGSDFEQIALPSPPSGRVTSLRRDGSRAFLLVVEDGGGVSENEISLNSGYIDSVRYMAGVTGPAFSLGAFLLSSNGMVMEVQGPAGTQAIPLAASALSLEKMTSEWVHITAANSTRHWALHLRPGASQLYELPGIPVAKVSK